MSDVRELEASQLTNGDFWLDWSKRLGNRTLTDINSIDCNPTLTVVEAEIVESNVQVPEPDGIKTIPANKGVRVRLSGFANLKVYRVTVGVTFSDDSEDGETVTIRSA